MNIRRAKASDLFPITMLYRVLQPDDPILDPLNGKVRQQWRAILRDERLRYFVAEAESGAVVACCALAIVPNLTRGMRPYGLIENVVTAPKFRKQGFGKGVLRAALDEAWAAGCYKVMLLTGRKEAGTLRFYERAGFVGGVKTGFVAYPKLG